MTNQVRDNVEHLRFELDLDGQTAFANYRRSEGLLTILHTEVPRDLRGHGIGSRLVRGLLDLARAKGVKVRPRCRFVAAYMDSHPEYADLRD